MRPMAFTPHGSCLSCPASGICVIEENPETEKLEPVCR